MPTETLPTRSEAGTEENVSRGFALALTGHILVVGLIAGSIWMSHRLNPHWGEADPTVGSIQASMVNSLPLPPRQRFKENEVLTSDKPSVAPTPPPPTPAPPTKAEPVKPKAEPPPKPNEILIPNKKPPIKVPLKAPVNPVTPRRTTPPPPPTPKATTGETAGVQIPQSVVQLRNGTASVTVPDRAFGDRYAYYIRHIAQVINEQKAQDVDPPETRGKRATIHFIIDRDGTPTEVQVETRSGSATLDMSTMRAIQRVDTFGPLPAGNQLPVTYIWDSR